MYTYISIYNNSPYVFIVIKEKKNTYRLHIIYQTKKQEKKPISRKIRLSYYFPAAARTGLAALYDYIIYILFYYHYIVSFRVYTDRRADE